MKTAFTKMFSGTVLALMLTTGLASISVFGQVDSKSESRGEGRFEGTWDLQITVRLCQTGAIIRTFPAIATFTAGGTTLVSESDTSPALKKVAQGVWSRVGDNSYRFKSKGFNFDANGNFTGWMTVSNEASLSRIADTFDGTGIARVYTPNGTLVFTGCSTLVATRFE